MKNILWLVSWYPNRIHPFDGDFIQRHAQALALYQPVYVIFAIKDEKGLITNGVKIESFNSGNLREVIAYYNPMRSGIKAVNKLFSIIKYLRVVTHLIRSYIKQIGLPGLVHVHVVMWIGLLAVYLKSRYKIPFIVTEHWTGYDKNALENLYKKGILFSIMVKMVLKQAHFLLPVSCDLGKRIHKNITPVSYKIIPNVVNTQYFKYAEPIQPVFRFIHVSTMTYQKNTSGILHCLSKLLLHSRNWEMVMVGPGGEDLKLLSTRLGLENNIIWKGEISYVDVAAALQQSSALIMFSRYENLPCVILEAQCCGLPVIATNVGGIPEIVSEDNGILIASENEQQLLQAMINIMQNYNRFNKKEIAEQAMSNYNYQVIGKKSKTFMMNFKSALASIREVKQIEQQHKYIK